MKITHIEDPIPFDEDDLQAEYDFSTSQPNPFAGNSHRGSVMTIDPDVAAVFRTPEAVNKALRAIIEAMPSPVEEQKAA